MKTPRTSRVYAWEGVSEASGASGLCEREAYLRQNPLGARPGCFRTYAPYSDKSNGKVFTIVRSIGEAFLFPLAK